MVEGALVRSGGPGPSWNRALEAVGVLMFARPLGVVGMAHSPWTLACHGMRERRIDSAQPTFPKKMEGDC